MPAEPERHVEKLLRSYAKRRSGESGAPLELTPEARQLLCDEAVRTHSRPRRRFALADFGALENLWPRLAFGGAVLAALVVALNLWRTDTEPASEPVKLARTTTPRPTEEADRAKEKLARGETAAKPSLAPAVPAEQAKAAPALAKEMAAPVSGVKVVDELSQKREAGAPAPKADSGGEMKRQDAAKPVQLTLTATRAAKPSSPAPLPAVPPALATTTPALVAKAAAVPPPAPAPAPSAEKTITEADWARLRAQLKFSEPLAAADKDRKLERPGDESGVDYLRRAAQIINQPEPMYGPYMERLLPAAPAAAGAPALAQSAKADQLPAPAVQTARSPQQAAIWRRNFSQLAVASPSAPGVLGAFQVEQAGEFIRFTDADGSVYEGLLASSAQSGEALKKQTAERQAGDGRQLMERRGGYQFTVSGTNRTLNQSVTFRGNFILTSGSQTANRAANEMQRGAQAGQLADQQAELMPDGVQGRASVGGAAEFELLAVPARK